MVVAGVHTLKEKCSGKHRLSWKNSAKIPPMPGMNQQAQDRALCRSLINPDGYKQNLIQNDQQHCEEWSKHTRALENNLIKKKNNLIKKMHSVVCVLTPNSDGDNKVSPKQNIFAYGNQSSQKMFCSRSLTFIQQVDEIN